MGNITRTTVLSVPMPQAYSIKLDSGLWHTWIDGARSPAKVEGDGGAENVCTLGVRVAGVTLPNRVQLQESACDSSQGRYVALVSNPTVRMKETWTFVPEAAGTRATWMYEYEPVGWRGLLLRPFLPRMLARSMERSLHNFQALCGRVSAAGA
jgi:hypothetical protein